MKLFKRKNKMVPTQPTPQAEPNPLDVSDSAGELAAIAAAEAKQSKTSVGSSPATEPGPAPEAVQNPHTIPGQAKPSTENYLGQANDRDEDKPTPDQNTPGDEERELARPFRSSVKHYRGELVTLGDSVASALAEDPESIEKIYLPSAGAEVPVSEFTWTSDGTQVGS